MKKRCSVIPIKSKGDGHVLCAYEIDYDPRWEVQSEINLMVGENPDSSRLASGKEGPKKADGPADECGWWKTHSPLCQSQKVSGFCQPFLQP